MWPREKQTGSPSESDSSDVKVTVSKKRYVSLSGIDQVLEVTRTLRKRLEDLEQPEDSEPSRGELTQ